MKRNMKRKGFTLVELLIVIVVIGILSAMMMLSSTEAVTSAQASNIVSNLRNLKTAALALYTDNLDDAVGLVPSAAQGYQTDVFKKLITYLNTGSGTENTSYKDYGIIHNAKGWYVYCSVSETRVQDKLKGRAKSVGLCGAAQANALDMNNVYGGTSNSDSTSNVAVAGMWVVNPGTSTNTGSSGNTQS